MDCTFKGSIMIPIWEIMNHSNWPTGTQNTHLPSVQVEIIFATSKELLLKVLQILQAFIGPCHKVFQVREDDMKKIMKTI